MKKPRIEILKMKVRRGKNGSSTEVVKRLNRVLKKNQRLIYLKHNTLLNNHAYWTAFIENT